MPLYRYEALDRTGNAVRGAMQVADERTLEMRLVSMGYQVTSAQVAQGGVQGTIPPAAPWGAAAPSAARPDANSSNASADERSIARMYYQLYQAFKAGMPAFQAFTTVQAQTNNSTLRKVLGEVSLGVRDGNRISVLMEPYPRIFSRGDIGMMRAAEQGGFLPDAIRSLAERMEADDNARRRLRIWVWFFHSNVLMLFAIIAVAAWFRPAIETMNAVVGLQAVGRVFLTVSLPLTVGYFGLVAWFYHARRDPKFSLRWHKMVLKLPAVGKVNFLRASAVFTRVLQQLYRAGVIAPEAWATAAASVPNLYLAETYGGGTPAVTSTHKFTAGMQAIGMDLTDVGMVATGEATGEIDEALNYLANRYEEDTRVALGASVIRGAITFVVWSFLLGGIAMLVVFQGSYGHLIDSVNKFMGVDQ